MIARPSPSSVIATSFQQVYTRHVQCPSQCPSLPPLGEINAHQTLTLIHAPRRRLVPIRRDEGYRPDTPRGCVYVLERFFSHKEPQKLFRSWAGSASMWIKSHYFSGPHLRACGTIQMR
ncbi:hypothetical protein OBBRIDRAFT_839485 [Obba rivulosa]|uniref:Uncharacterized protein n=1 Tax=Obba rivulosa TaxID=1052685 RepID=A0A8E2AM23_9APHY|nr:hypothetical protein OBBRIDRAFT_839485 [Obba rivulosa]